MPCSISFIGKTKKNDSPSQYICYFPKNHSITLTEPVAAITTPENFMNNISH